MGKGKDNASPMDLLCISSVSFFVCPSHEPISTFIVSEPSVSHVIISVTWIAQHDTSWLSWKLCWLYSHAHTDLHHLEFVTFPMEVLYFESPKVSQRSFALGKTDGLDVVLTCPVDPFFLQFRIKAFKIYFVGSQG